LALRIYPAFTPNRSKKMVEQQRKIGHTFPQGRSIDRNDIQTVVEVFSP